MMILIALEDTLVAVHRIVTIEPVHAYDRAGNVVTNDDGEPKVIGSAILVDTGNRLTFSLTPDLVRQRIEATVRKADGL